MVSVTPLDKGVCVILVPRRVNILVEKAQNHIIITEFYNIFGCTFLQTLVYEVKSIGDTTHHCRALALLCLFFNE